MLDFPDDTVDGEPPANAGNMGLIPSPGRLHRPWGDQAHVPQALSCTLGPRTSPQEEKPLHRGWGGAPACRN